MTKQPGLLISFVQFLGRHKFYWLVPLIILTLVFVAILILSSLGDDSLSPFMYADS
jgi:hypothetical protein